jgi:hypothetical protein
MNDLQQKKVLAEPTKQFFMHMLTRDIELKDAILDLLDNCIDGAMRSKEKPTLESGVPEEYEGYWAKIELTKSHFKISDNCGGISLDTAVDYAFRMGRPDQAIDSDIPSIGMYGIGMKRAIFKMGDEAKVTSFTDAHKFEVSIPKNWGSKTDWSFEIDAPSQTLAENGTQILITSLHDKVSDAFSDSENYFFEQLRSDIETHFAYLMQKGFKIYINDHEIRPKPINLIFSDKIEPYLFTLEYEGVTVKAIIGFRGAPPTDEDLEEEIKEKRRSHDAGWTVICNDRAVLVNDKTRITGWGDPPVPAYHTQFINITGVIEFSSNNANLLPLTTTKRGIDGNSEVYLAVKNFMKEGIKIFTDHTNKWKNDREAEQELFKESSALLAKDAISKIEAYDEDLFSKPRVKIDSDKNANTKKYIPKLPVPVSNNPNAKIIFSRPKVEVKEISEFFFESPNMKPSAIGEKCFDYVLHKLVKGKG